MPTSSASPREQELLEAAYAYVLSHGLATLSLRPLAEAVGSSPRVLLYLFGSKDGLVRALLARARRDELSALDGIRHASDTERVRTVWAWLRDPEHAPLIRLWTEAYGQSLVAVDGPWSGFAEQTVRDWLTILGDGPEATYALTVLRGAMLDLLATGDVERVDAAVELALTLG